MKELILKYGVMDCGKTILLIQEAYNYEKKGMKVRVIKPLRDTKGDDHIVSRLENLSRKVDYLIDDPNDLKEYLSKLKEEGVTCVLVDEAEFLNNDHISELFYFTKKYNIKVICYSLKSDFQGNIFSGTASLFALADVVEELSTICKCRNKATFNARIKNGEYITDGDQIAIDGEDGVSYESMCGTCYLKKVLK